VLAVVIPLAAAALWGIFAVPSDPSRSGSAPVRVPGILRLAIELGFFAAATWAVNDLGFSRLALLFGIAVVLHYLVSFDRVWWLVSQQLRRRIEMRRVRQVELPFVGSSHPFVGADQGDVNVSAAAPAGGRERGAPPRGDALRLGAEHAVGLFAVGPRYAGRCSFL
jgi:uncharacterized protein DUF2568